LNREEKKALHSQKRGLRGLRLTADRDSIGGMIGTWVFFAQKGALKEKGEGGRRGGLILWAGRILG